MVKKLEEKIREQINLIIAQEIEKAVKQIYETREEQDLAVDNAKLRERVRFLEMSLEEKDENCYSLAKENSELKEFKTRREESMFYFKALMERAEPKTASEAEDLQKSKEMFEKLYRQELSYLEEENKKLKSDLSECECSLGFENDEVGFWKGEYKRLKKWIKDHCKGYGNLFPEDEMKRQRKKADKKRK